MRLSVDSSSLAKRYVQEYGGEEIESLLQRASELALCIILVPELISALNRRQRERVLTVADYRQAKRQSLDDVRDATVLQIAATITVTLDSLGAISLGRRISLRAFSIFCRMRSCQFRRLATRIVIDCVSKE